MKTINEIAIYCVNEAINHGALRRPDFASPQASEAPAFLGPKSPLDGDYEYLRSQLGDDPAMLDEDGVFGLSHETCHVFCEAYETEMSERMAAQTAEDFPIEINTAKGSDRFSTVEAAAEWLVMRQPSFCDVNGEDFDWDGDTDEDEMVGVIAKAIRAALAQADE